MPDYEYRQTVVTLPFAVGGERRAGVPGRRAHPLRLGWKAVYQAVDPDGEAEARQTLPPLSDGETAIYPIRVSRRKDPTAAPLQ